MQQPSAAPSYVQEALAQRGLVTQGGHLRYPPAQGMEGAPGGDAGAAMDSIDPNVQPQDALAANAGAVGVGSGMSPPVAGAAPNASGVQGGNAMGDAAAQALFAQMSAESPNGDASGAIGALEAVGALAAGSAIAYAMWRRSRAQPDAAGATPPPSSSTAVAGGLRVGSMPGGDNIIDGEFTEVNEPRLPPPARAEAPKPSSVANELAASRGAQRRLSRDQAGKVQQRAARGTQSDVAPIQGQDMATHYSEEDIRHANALADELIAQRMQGQREVRSGRRRAGAPSAPINPARPNQGVSEARPSLVNEILRQIMDARNPAARILRRGIR